jgi:general secretion pathway protein E
MGIEPYLLSSTIVGILAQRLVRRICRDCIESYTPTEQEISSLGLKASDVPSGKFYRGKGCPLCYGLGYRGRHGLYELMVVNNPIRKQIVDSPDAIEMRRVALENGMTSLLDHGAKLVVEGISTVPEVLRVTRGVEEEG